MDSDQFRRRAASFDSVAEIYQRARPDYPDAAVAWLSGEPPMRVLDLGAGTGKLTRALADAGHDVVAVDPSEAMLSQLSELVPAADIRPGTAESLPVADDSVDVVTVAQAFHWFDHATALPEIARVLRPGGRLGLVWNHRDGSLPWVRELWEAIGPSEAMVVEPAALGELFGRSETAVFAHSQLIDLDGLLDLAASRSHVVLLSDDDRADVFRAMRACFEQQAGPDGLVLPYRTHCYRAAVS
ncbi:methyltransferase family protein [Haloactinopolyspora alba]|uniref:Methyltransferase family protein n=1 Tax=Haloactinopolyspora alba TaxID=648780 RepID=A0A2P8E7F3_9ACTN|nr:methyltransferase domain-containing protein [Haloactinopolyspora alba]PSL05402.1 methyltransferase family protein [Haloactinopolyspora alba]